VLENSQAPVDATSSALSTSDGLEKGGGPGKCPPEIERAYRNILNAINLERYEKTCKLNKAARKEVGLSVRVKRHTNTK
jgi:hypothetical protein